MMKVTIGIDPGKGGAVAVIGQKQPFSVAFGDDSIACTISDIYKCLAIEGFEIEACIEMVHSFPGQGVASSFAFGKAFGEAIGCLDALEIPYRGVSPQAWQKTINGIPKKKDGATAHKRALKKEAQRRFPSIKPTLKTCDALLIADYAHRLRK